MTATRAWVTPDGAGRGTSEFARRVPRCQPGAGTVAVETLESPARPRSTSPARAARSARTSPAATDDDKRALRVRRVRPCALIDEQLADLRAEYWISALEELRAAAQLHPPRRHVTLDVVGELDRPRHQEYETPSSNSIRALGAGAARVRARLDVLRQRVRRSPSTPSTSARTAKPSARGRSARRADTSRSCRPAARRSRARPVPAVRFTGDRRHRPAARRRRADQRVGDVRRDEATIDDAQRRTHAASGSARRAAGRHRPRPGHAGTGSSRTSGFGAKHLRDLDDPLDQPGPQRRRRRQPGDRRRRARRRAVPGLLGVRQARHRQRRQPPQRTPALVLRPRDSHEEATSELALARTLTTEGLVLRLPQSITLGDAFAMPVAVRGGAARTARTDRRRPRPPADRHRSSTPPRRGQTPRGAAAARRRARRHRLSQRLHRPRNVWDLLHRAWQVVRDCECRARGTPRL